MFYVSRLAGRGEQDAALPPSLPLLQQEVQQGGAHPFPGVPRVPGHQVCHMLGYCVLRRSYRVFVLLALAFTLGPWPLALGLGLGLGLGFTLGLGPWPLVLALCPWPLALTLGIGLQYRYWYCRNSLSKQKAKSGSLQSIYTMI